ncbi:MAG: class I SAM-dependent methyltransferase [Patescibacteria group bacterium]|nr:class I SAM-dependent methyltransferase [Patescibacteria group bacterium]
MNFFSKLSYFYTRKVLPGFKISKNALVVDIGSGDKPFWRADVYVDDLSLSNVQRASGTETIHDIGTFVDGTVFNLPFKDKAFDFSFTSHLLEHVENPAAAIKEIVRVSKMGYLEVPNGLIETMLPFKSHLWFVYRNKNKLIFVRKSKKMHTALSSHSATYKSAVDSIIQANPEPFMRLYWKNKIDYEIIDDYKPAEKFKAESEDNHNSVAGGMNFHILIVKMLRVFFYKNKKIPDNIYKKIRK